MVKDPLGRVTELTERLDWLLTKTTQCLRGWTGRVFDAAGPSYVELLTPEAVVGEVAYVLANPVDAGLVRYGCDWPGVRTRGADLGSGRRRIERPECFFAEDGALPEAVELRIGLPDMLVERHGAEGAASCITEAVERRERALRAEARAEGRRFQGAARVRKTSPYERAKSYEPRHGLNPRLAAGGDRRALAERKRQLADFCQRYASSWTRWIAGERDVVWPFGTDQMRRRHRVRCADPPT